jgi:Glycosyl hydrolases family 32 C terminal
VVKEMVVQWPRGNFLAKRKKKLIRFQLKPSYYQGSVSCMIIRNPSFFLFYCTIPLIYFKPLKSNMSNLTSNDLQADVEVEFSLPNLDNAEAFDSSWLADPEGLCGTQNATWKGAIGPFGLLVLASDTLDELTAVFFRVYRDQNRYMVLMCSDTTRFVKLCLISLLGFVTLLA